VPRKPCPYDVSHSQRNLILLPPGFSFLPAPTSLSRRLLRRKDACLPECFFKHLCSIGIMLSPVHFQGLEPRQVSCYAFFKCWLLLSLHPCCLRFGTPFVTLSMNFGTLTAVSLVRVSEQYLTYRPCFLSIAVSRF
jgi:hypothetical protein